MMIMIERNHLTRLAMVRHPLLPGGEGSMFSLSSGEERAGVRWGKRG
jgi:hypothetical protein